MSKRTYKPGTLRRHADGRYWFDIRIGGKRYIRILGVDKTQAQRELNKFKHEQGTEGGAHSPAAKKDPASFNAIADQFYSTYCLGKTSERSFDNSLRHLRGFFGETAFLEIAPLDVEAYKSQRLTETFGTKGDKRYSKASLNRELACLKRMLSWAEDIAEIPIPMPIKKVKLFPKKESEHTRERILSDEEQAALLAHSPSHIRPIIQTALWTGMRLGEILRLKWTDLRLRARMPEVVVRGENAKDGETRRIPIIPKLSCVLEALPRTSEYVFVNPDTDGPRVSIKQSFSTARLNAKLQDARFHDLRHTFATMCIERGVDLVTLQQWMGHSTIVMTARYVKAGSEFMRQKMEMIADAFPEEVERKLEGPGRPASVSPSSRTLYA